MSSSTTHHTYSIKEAAALSGLPASTLRYYESVGVLSPVGRGVSSKHRVYGEQDLDRVMWVACLAATGMSVEDMRQYVANGALGASAAHKQVELLTAQKEHLAREAELVELRREYVDLKIQYWRAVEAGDEAQTEALSAQARGLGDRFTRVKRN